MTRTLQSPEPSHSPMALAILLITLAIAAFVWWPRHLPRTTTAPPPCQHWISITGDVQRPGIACLVPATHPPHKQLTQLLIKSRPACQPPQRLPVPRHGQELLVTKNHKHSTCQVTQRDMPAQRRVQLGIPLSLNHATQQDLQTIPKLRKRIAARIVAYRNKHGAFRQLDELLHIKGIGPKTLQALRPYLTLIDPSDRTRHRKKEASAMP